MLLFNRFDFINLRLSGLKVNGPFEKLAPGNKEGVRAIFI